MWGSFLPPFPFPVTPGTVLDVQSFSLFPLYDGVGRAGGVLQEHGSVLG